MTTDPHERYEELVAGHALSALEPEDEQLLLQHLASCAACERAVDLHRETLAHLAYAVDLPPPLPDSVWDSIRGQVLASGTPASFSPAEAATPVDLAAERRRRGRTRGAAVLSAAAALALVAGLAAWNVSLQRDRAQLTAAAERLSAAVAELQSGPAQTVPLRSTGGDVTAVALVHPDRVSLVVDGLERNDPSSSIYVLWGKSGNAPAQAVASFDVPGGEVSVVRDLALPSGGGAVPELLVITREPGRTAPAATEQPALATGRRA